MFGQLITFDHFKVLESDSRFCDAKYKERCLQKKKEKNWNHIK